MSQIHRCDGTRRFNLSAFPVLYLYPNRACQKHSHCPKRTVTLNGLMCLWRASVPSADQATVHNFARQARSGLQNVWASVIFYTWTEREDLKKRSLSPPNACSKWSRCLNPVLLPLEQRFRGLWSQPRHQRRLHITAFLSCPVYKVSCKVTPSHQTY
jgi:hypothetical protein